MAMLLGPFWAAALGANVVGAEYQYGTWPWLLVRKSRLELLLVKIVTMSARIVFMAIRFKETASWIPYVHLENLEERFLSGKPSLFLTAALDFHMSAGASIGVIACELLVLFVVAYAVFRRQQIVY